MHKGKNSNHGFLCVRKHFVAVTLIIHTFPRHAELSTSREKTIENETNPNSYGHVFSRTIWKGWRKSVTPKNRPLNVHPPQGSQKTRRYSMNLLLEFDCLASLVLHSMPENNMWLKSIIVLTLTDGSTKLDANSTWKTHDEVTERSLKPSAHWWTLHAHISLVTILTYTYSLSLRTRLRYFAIHAKFNDTDDRISKLFPRRLGTSAGHNCQDLHVCVQSAPVLVWL